MSATVVLLTMIACALALAGCGSSPTPASSPVAQTPGLPSLNSTWATVGQLGVPLVSLVVANSPGFDETETSYLSRCNMAWQTIQRTCAETAKADQSGDAATRTKAVIQTVASTTALWLRTKAPSQRFAPLHKQVTVLARRLGAMSQLAKEHGVATSQTEKDDLSARFTTSVASIAALADRVASKAEQLRDKYGEAWYPEPLPVSPATADAQTTVTTAGVSTTATGESTPPAVAITTAERKQIKAIVDDSMWITEPLKEAQAMMMVPVPQWGLGDVFNFCLDMGFIQATCRDWMKKQPAGPNVAYSFDQYISGLRLLNKAAGQLIYMAENESISAGRRGAANLKRATPYIGRAMAGFKVLLPSAFEE